jgi:hypothetical protein
MKMDAKKRDYQMPPLFAIEFNDIYERMPELVRDVFLKRLARQDAIHERLGIAKPSLKESVLKAYRRPGHPVGRLECSFGDVLRKFMPPITGIPHSLNWPTLEEAEAHWQNMVALFADAMADEIEVPKLLEATPEPIEA